MLDILRLAVLNDTGNRFFTQESVGLLAVLQQRVWYVVNEWHVHVCIVIVQ